MKRSNEERIFIIVDGSNFYHRLKEAGLSGLLGFNYKEFAGFLTGERKNIVSNYYIGAIREEPNNQKSRELMINQQKLIGRLKICGWQVHFGHMLKTDGYHEKGVDVLMVIDLLIGAYENLYDTAVLVSSDTDLIPAIAKVRAMGKKVEYIGFSSKPSFGLIAHADIRRLLIKDELLRFLR